MGNELQVRAKALRLFIFIHKYSPGTVWMIIDFVMVSPLYLEINLTGHRC